MPRNRIREVTRYVQYLMATHSAQCSRKLFCKMLLHPKKVKQMEQFSYHTNNDVRITYLRGGLPKFALQNSQRRNC